MDDVDVAIVEAWDRVKLFLARDPAECRKRLARQQQITLRNQQKFVRGVTYTPVLLFV